MREAMHSFLKTSGLDRHMRDFPVFEAWRTAAGENVARRARAVRFRDGELVVEVESAAHLQELKSFTGEGLRQRANQPFGREVIRSIAFKLKQ
jgi:hypothetical protein